MMFIKLLCNIATLFFFFTLAYSSYSLTYDQFRLSEVPNVEALKYRLGRSVCILVGDHFEVRTICCLPNSFIYMGLWCTLKYDVGQSLVATYEVNSFFFKYKGKLVYCSYKVQLQKKKSPRSTFDLSAATYFRISYYVVFS